MTHIAVVCGPTASGKSDFALQLAKQWNAIIINADALQVYKQIPIITASPTKKDQEIVGHFLYNHIDVWQNYSVAAHIKNVTEAINSLTSQNAIIVGGSGMYINSLIYGAHKIPSIDSNLRNEIRLEIEQRGITGIYQKLQKLDSISASKLSPTDSKRISRAYEVFMQTGNSIYSFYKDENLYHPLKKYSITIFYLCPERDLLYQNCNKRFAQFIQIGAINEAKELLDNHIDLSVTAAKALGLQEIFNYLKGLISLQDAVLLAQQKTRNFAKRQVTWFSNQLQNNHKINFATIDEYYKKLEICKLLLSKI
jgi:tRNA dimethylallyltransferase